MKTRESFSESIYEQQTQIARRELSAFLSLVVQQYGLGEAYQAETDWLDESESMDGPPLSTSRDWHAVTIAASARLADEIAGRNQGHGAHSRK